MRMMMWVLLVAVIAGCGSTPKSDTIRIALNWFPESEHGGFFAAFVNGYYAADHHDVTLVPGGPGVPVLPRVASREMDFGVVNADELVGARAAGVPVVALMAPIHQSPLCIMVHAESPMQHLADLRGVTLAIQPGTPQIAWLERKVGLRDVRVVPYTGTVAAFLANPQYAQQGYVFSEPIVAEAAGANVRCLPFAESGWNPYASMLVTSEALLREKPALAREIAAASVRGWEAYVKDPGPTHEHILTRNPQIDRAALDAGAKALVPLVVDDDARRDGVGSMTAERWTTLVAQMREIGAIDAAVDPAKCYVTDAGKSGS